MTTTSHSRAMLLGAMSVFLSEPALATSAAVRAECPTTVTAARALLARQGKQSQGDAYPQRFNAQGLTVLGVSPTAVTVAREPGILWSFSYELQSSYEVSPRRNFAAAYTSGSGFNFHCPANSQCLWSADGFGINGPPPRHPLGTLLQVGLTSSYSNPGAYTLECLYLIRRL